jgi:hypothetical protein
MKFIYVLSLLALSACNLEKEIEITLPDYNSAPFVECYLEEGLPLRLLLTRSSSFFSNFNLQDPEVLQSWLYQNAVVNISFKGNTYRLLNIPYLDPITGKFYNYFNPVIPDSSYPGPFLLEILLPDGEKISGQTEFLEKVKIDSVVIQFNEDSKARALTYFSDPPDTKNFYRRVLHKNNLRSEPLQSFTTDDRISSGTFVFGSGYEFEVGDTVINNLYHIDQPYFNFLESIQRAVSGNGNPFAQPSPIQSNINGKANGIFTWISKDQTFHFVKK